MNRLFAIILLACLSFGFVGAQTTPTLSTAIPAADKVQLQTPRSTIETHLMYLQDESYEPSVAGKVFPIADQEQAKDLAIKLKQILDSEGLFVDLEVVPNNADYVDSLTKLNRYVLFAKHPDIYVEKINDSWYYSRRTVEMIPEIHDATFSPLTDFLINLIPSISNNQMLGLKVWQLIGILFFSIIGVILHKLLTIVLEKVIAIMSRRFTHLEGQVDLIHAIAKPLSVMVIVLLLGAFTPSLMLPVKAAKFVLTMLNILTPIFATLTMYRLVDLVSYYMERLAEKSETTLDDQLVPLVRKSLKIFVVIIGILFILQNLNVNITTLLAGLSIGGLAFALAAQDTIKNLFGSLMIFVDRPFQIGDGIIFEGQLGTVEEVGFRSTRVRTPENSLVSVPNGRIADMTIDNRGLRVYRRFNTSIALTYDTSTVLINAYVDGLRKIVELHPNTRKDSFEIHLNNMGAHSLDVLFNIYFIVPDWSGELKARHEMIMSIIELAEALGVRFAFPTQTLFVEEVPGQASLTPKMNTDPEAMKQKIAQFLEKKAKELKA